MTVLLCAWCTAFLGFSQALFDDSRAMLREDLARTIFCVVVHDLPWFCDGVLAGSGVSSVPACAENVIKLRAASEQADFTSLLLDIVTDAIIARAA